MHMTGDDKDISIKDSNKSEDYYVVGILDSVQSAMAGQGVIEKIL